MYTVSLALRMFADPGTSTDWGAIFAMGTLSLLPILAVFSLFQRYLVEGISHPLHKKSVQKALDGLRRYGRDA